MGSGVGVTAGIPALKGLLVDVKGFISTSLVDYPGNIASVAFLGGCNFRCPYCYNIELVLQPEEVPTIPEQQILEDVERRKGFIDGVVITGGEPTLSPDLPEFLKKVKQIGVLVKLDTNGSKPKRLEQLLREQLVDFVAMDYKAPLGRYSEVVGVNVDTEAIELSARLLIGSRTDHEFRTTVHPGLLDPEDIVQIAREIREARRYVLQPFYSTACLDPSIGLPPGGYLKHFADALNSVDTFFEETVIRGGEY